MPFENALTALKEGHKIRLPEWAEGVHLALGEIRIAGGGTETTIYAIRRNDRRSTWLPKSLDLLSDHWELYEPEPVAEVE